MLRSLVFLIFFAVVGSGCISKLPPSVPDSWLPPPPPAPSGEGVSGEEEAPQPSVERSFRKISAVFYVGAVVALFFRHTWAAGCLFAGAVAGPVVGRMADLLLAWAVYLALGALAVGLIAAWYLLRQRFKLPDDGNLLSAMLKGVVAK